MRFRFLILLFVLSFGIAQALPPDIGDNSFFKCIEVEDDFQPGMCYGDISWISNKNGFTKGGKTLNIKKARKIINKAIRFFKKQEKKALRQGNDISAAIFAAKKQNARESKADLNACYFDYYDTCNGELMDNGSEANFPSLAEACKIVSDPNNYGELNRNRSKKFIVNGKICSNSIAKNSPVLNIKFFGDQYCTGTLITSTVVLTAAHCIEDIDCTDLLVVNASGTQSINVTECLANPGYNQGFEPQQNDNALLTLANAFNDIIPAKVVTSSAQVGDAVVFAGYGRNEAKDTKLRATFNEVSDLTTEVISTFYKRGDVNEGTSCNGDSGGPLFVFANGQWQTHGTLSDGSANNCALPGTNPNSDISNWANLASPSNQNFIRDNTSGVLD